MRFVGRKDKKPGNRRVTERKRHMPPGVAQDSIQREPTLGGHPISIGSEIKTPGLGLQALGGSHERQVARYLSPAGIVTLI